MSFSKTSKGGSSDGSLLSPQFEHRAVSAQFLKVRCWRVLWRQRRKDDLVAERHDIHHCWCTRILLPTDPLSAGTTVIYQITSSPHFKGRTLRRNQVSRCHG